ncbi:efflux RND transporter periplasmic adaptor subunit [Microbulbifer yueqingensis]|uniref:HlyD family secretion protein n=1 Tax=Microbulbifer yueqingensis TaxID=658219 RepID=A0A1G8ZFB8_9GAMM|nr:HlyD family efflux transporter periplasmic adaptor subunit [Microbulbifer yueqingensis]SDK12860.1 HlyD family secretion protein [Microbulbifer yueqingensis]
MRAKLLRRLVIIGLLAVLVLFFAWAFLPKPVPVDLAGVSRGPMEVYVRDEGYTRVKDVFVVSAPVTGYLLRVDKEVGDTVTAYRTELAQLLPTHPQFLDERTRNQAMATIRSAQSALELARAERRDAEAQLEFARADARRFRQLAEKDFVSQSELERVELALDSAEASLASARAAEKVRQGELENARAALIPPREGKPPSPEDIVKVTAPVSGQVLQLRQESESVVEAGTPLLDIGNPSQLEVVVDLLSRDAVQVNPGDYARFTRWGGDNPLHGTVRVVEPFGFTKISALGIEEQRVNVIIELDDPRREWQRLGHGYRVDAAVRIWRGEKILQVPTGTLIRYRGKWAVFRVRGGQAELVPVEIGHNNGQVAEVLDGLVEGDTLVLHPSERIEDGVAVEKRAL